MSPTYLAIARLLAEVAPLVFEGGGFALKVGTAINLFLRETPRLSVDLDLVFTNHRMPELKLWQRRIGKQALQVPGPQWLDQVVVESGVLGLSPVGVLAPPGQRHDPHRFPPRLGADPPCRLKPVYLRRGRSRRRRTACRAGRGGPGLYRRRGASRGP